jgi:PAS domain-containing protein
MARKPVQSPDLARKQRSAEADARCAAFQQQIAAWQQRIATLHQRREDLMAPSAGLGDETVAELQTALEELHVMADELEQQNEELTAMWQVVETDRQRYQELFDFAPDGYLVTSLSGVIREANRAAVSLLHTPLEVLVGLPLGRFVAQEERRTFHLHLSRLPAVARLQHWEVRLQPGGRGAEPSFLAALTVEVARDPQGRLVGLRWLLRDLTEQQRAETIRQSQQELADFFEHAPIGCHWMESDGTILHVNQAELTLLGYTREE